ncbi:peroxisome assembly protein 26 [Oryzias melastigma]|uniref:Peroxisomal biogenesis factor 26 n=1 Tax=Oryzias melastigma TaxID=30732 RepID=A0A3B3D2J6_ORYME|nr:peroxisome assembly protein 26 [Oryzias melastigma]
MSSCSTRRTPSSFGSVSSPPPPPSSAALQMINMLDSAAEQMMVHRDFQAVFDTCQRGLEKLAGTDDNRCAELKAGFCILGIQALAELNQWHGVLAWVLQQYERQENIPAKIMQMCILLYSKVGEAAEMQEAARLWLNCPSNSRSAGFRTVAELYLLHVLVPLGHFKEAREFIAGEVGAAAFAERQQAALDIVEEKAQQSQEAALRSGIHPGSSEHPNSVTDVVIHKLEAMLRFLYRKILTAGSGLFPLRRLFLVAVILYMLFSRLDPAAPSSFMWISKLSQLFKQTWRTMFAPYYQTVSREH